MFSQTKRTKRMTIVPKSGYKGIEKLQDSEMRDKNITRATAASED